MKLKIAVFFIMVISVILFPVYLMANTPRIGDADGDGRLTSADATLIARYLAGHFKNIPDHFTHTEEWKRIADTTCEGEVSINSLVRLTQLLMGQVDTLCPEDGCLMCKPTIKPSEVTADDFELIISLEETTLPQGEDFAVNVELKNNSGKDVEMAGFFLFYPRIRGEKWIIDDSWREPFFGLFDKDDTISQTVGLNSYFVLAPGVYDFTVETIFFLNVNEPFCRSEYSPWTWIVPDDAQRITISAETITLTITENDLPFTLTISAEEMTLPLDDFFTINVDLKNNSNDDYEIVFGILFQRRINGIVYRDFGERRSSSAFKANSTFRNMGYIPFDERGILITPSRNLGTGTHEYQLVAEFFLNVGQETIRAIQVWSNPITLIVQ